jgi:KTSC domain
MSAERWIRMVPVTSDSLAAIGYDSSSETLRVKFRNGGVYDYFDVAPGVYAGLLADQPHPWGPWREHITSAYRYRRVDFD